MRPNFGEPLDTAKQLVEQNITLYGFPGGEIWKQFLQESSIDEYNILGDNMIIADDWDHFDNITYYDVIGKDGTGGTHALMTASISSWELTLGKWYRSQEKVGGHYPYGGYLTNKKWHLNEVIMKLGSGINL